MAEEVSWRSVTVEVPEGWLTMAEFGAALEPPKEIPEVAAAVRAVSRSLREADENLTREQEAVTRVKRDAKTDRMVTFINPFYFGNLAARLHAKYVGPSPEVAEN